MKLYKKKGYEDTTVRVATDDSKAPIAIIGTVKDLLAVGLFDYCMENESKWAIVPANEDDAVRYADSRNEAIELLK